MFSLCGPLPAFRCRKNSWNRRFHSRCPRAVFCTGKIKARSVLQCDSHGIAALRRGSPVEPEGDRRDRCGLPVWIVQLNHQFLFHLLRYGNLKQIGVLAVIRRIKQQPVEPAKGVRRERTAAQQRRDCRRDQHRPDRPGGLLFRFPDFPHRFVQAPRSVRRPRIRRERTVDAFNCKSSAICAAVCDRS